MGAPLASVVIAALNGPACATRCLEALTAQAGARALELLVVTRPDDELGRTLRQQFPGVEVLAAREPGLPRMLAQGLRQARGELVAVLADRFVPGPGWVAAIEAARRAGRAVLGGPVENEAAASLLDWAVYLSEYAAFMEPFPAGPIRRLPGNNVVYERGLAAAVAAALEAGREDAWPVDERGLTRWADPDLRVTLCKRHRWAASLAGRFHAGRVLAARRAGAASAWRRLAYACAAPGLPLLLFARLALVLARKRRHRARLVWASPALAALLLSGAWGEGLGALAGPGRSLERLD